MIVNLLFHWGLPEEYGRMFSFLVSWKYERRYLGGLGNKSGCLISVKTKPDERYKPLCAGQAFCHPHDEFSKGFARRLSLKRALEKIFPALKEMVGLDFLEFTSAEKMKKVRQSFWDAYFTQIKDKCGKSVRFLPADAASKKA